MADEDSAAQLQALQSQLQAYDRHLAGLERSLAELQTAIATLEGLQGDGTVDAKVPVGAGVRIAASVDTARPVMMDVGAGYTSEVSLTDALTNLRDRLTSTESAFRTASAEAEKVGMEFQRLQSSS